MSTLAHDEVKYEVIELKFSNGLSDREISDLTGIPRSTLGDFFRKESHKDFWLNYESKEDSEEVDTDIENLCESDDWHVANLAKRLRTAQKTNTQLRRALNASTDTTSHIPEMIKAVEKATANLAVIEDFGRPLMYRDDQERICEILLSDYQIGKKGQHYNSNLAEQAMRKYGEQIVKTVSSNNTSKIILALIGDLVEDHMKHGVQSATSTDCGLSEQMALAIEHLWKYIVKPIAEFGIKTEVVCIAGNHGSSQHKGMDMYKAGLFSYDYVIYKALEGYCKVSGFDQVKFIIPEGCFGYTDIFGRYVVYEHGYFNTATEKSLEDQRNKRANQMKRHVEYFRCGDMHHVCNYDNGKLVVNGAFFGVDTAGEEYSGILGFSSIPAQVIMVHEDDKSVGRNTVKETIVVQVADGY